MEPRRVLAVGGGIFGGAAFYAPNLIEAELERLASGRPYFLRDLSVKAGRGIIIRAQEAYQLGDGTHGPRSLARIYTGIEPDAP